ncbi:MAG: acetate/propionate family kinase [Pseudomonadota bacterium]
MKKSILTINVGSSSIKFAVFSAQPKLSRQACLNGEIEGIGSATARLNLRYDGDKRAPWQQVLGKQLSHAAAFELLLKQLEAHAADCGELVAVGHRVVHGGTKYLAATRINAEVLLDLKAFSTLAPLHQPYNLAGITKLSEHLPQAIPIACFDTAFHHTQTPLAQQFALPRKLSAAGIKRYGFHGLSYEYIAHVLPSYTPRAEQRVIVAHLGNGASLCALQKRRSQASSMGFSALDGLMMGTRCGALDPGVLLYLMQQKGISADALSHLLYQESGLLGVSGISQDVRTLLASSAAEAAEAIDLFCYQANRHIGALAAEIGGLDVLVFTGGIGEHASEIRRRICLSAHWLGLSLDAEANDRDERRISQHDSRVEALVIATDEEWMIAHHSYALCLF